MSQSRVTHGAKLKATAGVHFLRTFKSLPQSVFGAPAASRDSLLPELCGLFGDGGGANLLSSVATSPQPRKLVGGGDSGGSRKAAAYFYYNLCKESSREFTCWRKVSLLCFSGPWSRWRGRQWWGACGVRAGWGVSHRGPFSKSGLLRRTCS